MPTTLSVDISIEGEPALKSGTQILALAKKTKFNERGKIEQRHGRDSSITYVPRRDSIRDALARAVMQGLLLCKIIIKGEPPQGINLVSGTYYYFIHNVRNRWLGFAVNEQGRIACTTTGVVVSQTFNVHPDKPHSARPQVTIHPIASPKERRRLGSLRALWWWEVTTWTDKIGEPGGPGSPGCTTPKSCSPAT
jgi:hypothetical protein